MEEKIQAVRIPNQPNFSFPCHFWFYYSKEGHVSYHCFLSSIVRHISKKKEKVVLFFAIKVVGCFSCDSQLILFFCALHSILEFINKIQNKRIYGITSCIQMASYFVSNFFSCPHPLSDFPSFH